MGNRFVFFWLTAGILLIQLAIIVSIPMADSTEPRYAEIARLMLLSNDWITPWFEPEVPFWGKPPLLFWGQTLSFKLFGTTEFSARLPSLLATMATVWILWLFALKVYSRQVADQTLLVFITTSVVFVTAGAVITDPYLVLGTTWSMAAFYIAPTHPAWYWRYGFFLGLSIGMLAKGPLTLAITLGPVLLWTILIPQARQHFKAMPWASGIAIVLSISLPWYLVAEVKTPGFLNYFLIGEHFLRFIDPGWAGDLYGSAHERPKGMIWLFWLVATFPWGLMAFLLLIRNLRNIGSSARLRTLLLRPLVSYLVLWTLFLPVFFSPASNILWTYLLPSMPAFALLSAMALNSVLKDNSNIRIISRISVGIVPLLGIVAIFVILSFPNILQTEKELVAEAVRLGSQMTPAHEGVLIYFLEKDPPFSARFYSHGAVERLSLEDFNLLKLSGFNILLAIPNGLSDTRFLPPLQKHYQNNEYALVRTNF